MYDAPYKPIRTFRIVRPYRNHFMGECDPFHKTIFHFVLVCPYCPLDIVGRVCNDYLMNKKGSANMATQTLNKYNMMRVGDRIAMTKSSSVIKGGIITEIKGVNQYAKTIKTSNGGVFHITRWSPSEYEIYRDVNHTPTA